ncbi:MAG: hypothetical protein EOM91_18610 [Sphingobacteriia bacterium]|nr:hypothetical protein [Sphingobacteriia bacterium]
MKPKPDVSSFDGLSKDPSDFLDGARTESPGRPAVGTPTPAPVQPETREVTLAVAKPEPTVPKMFRLRWDVAAALKFGAAQESITSGRRVTETEIVERLLKKYYKF